MSTLIRRATRTDLPSVMALYRQLRPDDPPQSDLQLARLWTDVAEGPYSCLVIAEVDDVSGTGRVAGATCMLATIANLASGGRRIGLIEHVITASEFRRRGLARQVLAYALDQAWQADCCKVLLLSGAQRVEAHGLYESIGFRGDVERGFVAKPPLAVS